MNQSMRVKTYLTAHRYQIVTAAVLLLLCGLGGYLRFHQIGKLSLWLDESITYNQSKGSLRLALNYDTNMSLFWFLAHFWIHIIPKGSEAALRALPALFSLAGIPAVFLLGQTLSAVKKKAAAIGLTAALLIAVNAYQVEYAQEFRSYSLFFLTATLSTFMLIKTIQRPDGPFLWPVGYTLVTAAAFYSHYYAVLVMAAQALSLPVLLLDKERRGLIFKRLLYCAIAIGVLILPMIIIALRKGTNLYSWIPRPTWLSVQKFFESISGNAQGMSLTYLGLVLVCIGALAGLAGRFGRDPAARWKVVLLLSCLFMPVALSVIISDLLAPIFMARYLISVMACGAVLAAAGIVELGSLGEKKRLLRSLSVAAGLAALGWYVSLSALGLQFYYKHATKEDWRAASQFLTQRCLHSLRLYYHTYMDVGPIFYNPSLESQVASWWNLTLHANVGAEEIAAGFPQEYDQVCLILSHDFNKQQEQVILDAIQMKYPLQTDTFKFTGGEIRIFRRR